MEALIASSCRAVSASGRSFPLGERGSSPDAGGRVGTDGNTAAGGGSSVGGTGRGGGAWAGGSVDAAGADRVKGDVGQALEDASGVVGDSAPRSYDSRGSDRAADSADGRAAAPEVGAAGTDTHTGGPNAGDASCLNNDCGPSIVLSLPAAMKCNLDGSTSELSWTELSTWNPTYDSLICGNAGAYSIQGRIDRVQPGLQVLAEVYAAEDSTWHPISGGPTVRPDAGGGFRGSFCLPQKELDRTFRFRIVQQKTSQDAGVACLIHERP